MKIIRGFADNTEIKCSSCHHKCCATEYMLPLLPDEARKIKKQNPNFNNLIYEIDSREYLLRGNSCPFLAESGKCTIHEQDYFPLACQVYPLILWKPTKDLVVVWIDPCFGHGFKWYSDKYSDSQFRISDYRIRKIVEKADPFFTEFWGDDIDVQNPYKDISLERIRQEEKFVIQNISLENILNPDRITEIIEMEYFLLLMELSSIDTIWLGAKSLGEAIKPVLHWLSWSPVGLSLSFQNSKFIFLLALCLILELDSFQNERTDNYINQVASFLAQAITPLFWKQIKTVIGKDERKKFLKRQTKILWICKKIEQLLKGELFQEDFEKEILNHKKLSTKD